jgi:CRISPR-associated protein Csm5
MSAMKHYHFHISTLSPVHIGSNETYEPTNYIIDDDALYEFTSEDVIKVFDLKEKEKLNRIVTQKPNDMMLTQLQTLFYEKKESLMAQSSHKIPVVKGVADLYKKRIGKTANRESTGNVAINKLIIEKTQYTPSDHNPIIPGSSIKGAIRTALLDSINQGQRTRDREKSKAIQERLFNYGMRDLAKDPMRLVHISDAIWDGEKNLPGSEVQFAVNRKKKKTTDKNGKIVVSMAEQKGLYQLLESIPENCEEILSGQINLQKMNTINTHKCADSTLQWTAQDIAQACNKFYDKQFQKEQQILIDQNLVDQQWFNQLMKSIKQKQSTDNHGFLLRVGRHSGAESVTMNGVRSIKIMGGKGKKPTYESNTKTFWLSASNERNQSNLLPFGWIWVELTEINQPIKLQFNKKVSFRDPNWLEKHNQKQQLLKQNLDEKLKKQQIVIKQKQKQAQEEQKKAIALAEMTDEEKRIFKIQELFESCKKANTLKPGDETGNTINSLLEDALTWDEILRNKAADLAVNYYTATSWGNSKKKKLRKAKIEKLRNP